MKLPDNVKRIDVLRVEYGKQKLCLCDEPHYSIDYQNRLVYCVECKAIVDPFEALVKLAVRYERIGEQVNALLEQRKEIMNYKPRLAVIKELERHYCSQHFSMVPCCPRCNQPFDLPELTQWANRAFLSPKDSNERKRYDDE